MSTKILRELKHWEMSVDKKFIYNAVMPMWDNAPRRNNKGSVIFEGTNTDIYKCWLKEIIRHNQIRTDLDDNLVFISAWNEWAEGAYLEPDMKFGYAYLNATKQAVLNVRSEEESGE